MKNLNIMMTIKANNTKEAESIVTRELAELAKCIARHNGSFMIGGKCDVTEVASGNYKAIANMEITEYAEMNDTIYTVQAVWMTKPEIIKSAIFVSESNAPKAKEEPKNETAECSHCGKIASISFGVMNQIVSPEGLYYLCDDCLDDAMHNGDVYLCDYCATHVSDLVENPVTHVNNICPCCGETLEV